MPELNQDKLDEVLFSLQSYIEREQFKGYDPIDIFNSFLPFGMLPALGKAALSQAHMRNPLNLRPVLGIRKEYNPMSLGVLLKAYSLYYEHTADNAKLANMLILFQLLVDLSVRGFSGYCWGNNFTQASSGGIIPKNHPNLVTTCKVAEGIFEFHRVTQDRSALNVLLEIVPFILKDIPRIMTADGICFSYTNLKEEACYNANMMAAETLAKIYSLSAKNDLLKFADEAVAFTMAHQQRDGHWNYSIDLKTGIERQQIDFHQGYILCSLLEFQKHSGKTMLYRQELDRGATYYREKQFFENGRAKWRLPKIWPCEMHHHAVGIITFASLSQIDGNYLPFAQKIADWAIINLYDRRGFFYFRKCKRYINRISYLRWSLSYSYLALTMLHIKSIEQ